jgi:hypothetical protein
MSMMAAKVLAEGVLFIANFAIQRDFVFTRHESASPRTTDWDRYYASVPATAKLTRRYSTSVLLDAIGRHARAGRSDGQLSIVEIWGANSCFLDAILSRIPCRSYDVVDTNEYGLALLSGRTGDRKVVRLYKHSIFDGPLHVSADPRVQRWPRRTLQTQGDKGGRSGALRLFAAGRHCDHYLPDTTHLYRITRGFIEALGMWRFPDERPHEPQEVMDAVRERGEAIWEKMLWPLILTQYMIVARKRCASDVELP